ncbi:ABC transporter ATP-binding protein [Clostridium gasigenes]|uniref:ABC transporter ATP-binding protein n=1 Tax=Clostridium gasigenes TaxID=94869 RepID=UPI001C0BAAF6|nr:ABC transporter ATP-binding protein [Clostridium gasigenes]MBU3109289.1 ABC transporter ATP-binding protein [Clostridium gasigenes]
MNYIKLDSVYKNYQVDKQELEILKDINCSINQGEFVVILGPSGSGKSTLLNLLGGMDTVTKGEININGQIITNFKRKQLSMYRKEKIGFVFQFYNLISTLTVFENVNLSERMSKDSEKTDVILSELDVNHRRNNFPFELSGGEQQRVSIARAICKNPDIILCDEPTGALDSKTGKTVISVLYNICKQRKSTVIIVTHNASIAKIADRVIELRDGRVINNRVQEKTISVEDVEL